MPDEPWTPAVDNTRENVTIYEVAARAGVSIATVSHALNRPERVADATRRRILETAEELGFVPRGRGRSVRSVRCIAVSGPFSEHPTYLARLVGVMQAAVQIDVVVIDDTQSRGELLLDRIPARAPLDGVILMGAEPTPRLAKDLEDAGVAVVLLDLPSRRYTSVTVSDEAGGALVADHLLAFSVQSIATVSPAPSSSDVITSGELRVRGFTTRLREAGMKDDLPWVICDDSFEGGRAAGVELAGAARVPDAIFALHDVIASGVVAGLRASGLRVPEDVRVVGYDDVEAAEVCELTTVRQPFRESGAVAVEALRTLRADPSRPVAHLTLMPELIVRASTVGSGTDER